MWCICNQGSALGKEVHARRLSDPLGNSTASPGSCTSTQPWSLLSHAACLAGSLTVLGPHAQHPICFGPSQALGLSCVQTSLYKILKFMHQSHQIKTRRQVSTVSVYKTITRATSGHASISSSSSLFPSGLFNPIISILIISKIKKRKLGRW